MHSAVQKLKKMRTHLSLPSFGLNHTISNILFISFIAFHLAPSFGDDAVDEFKACGVSYNCGELVNITYPFWGNERQGFCGRREFELNCKRNRTTTIQINSFEYNVLRINQSGHRMTIARSDLLDDYCPKHKHQIETATLDYHLFMYSSNNRNVSVWYNCQPQEGIPDDYRFWCGWEGERNGSGNNYAFEAAAMNLSRNMRGCGMKIEVTVTTEVLKEGSNNRRRLVEKAVRGGFDVEYGNLYTVACNDCEKNGGKCGGNGTDPFYCICGSGVCGSDPAPVVLASGGFILAIFVTIVMLVYYIVKCYINKDKTEEIIRKNSKQTPKRYSYSKLKKVTNSFKNKLGQGGFSTVYKGKLSDGRDVAVKLLNQSTEDGQDFINEVVSITKTSHVNIVTLLGFCYEGKKRALIYEYMPKGSLDKYITHKRLQKNEVKLDWNTLCNIVIGIARGLEYLHRGCNTRIVHFDIKPHNILLDDELRPKISDFGLAKQCKTKQSYVSLTGAKGTVGFMAPEVIFRNVGKVSHKSDVYSYGMLVLDMVGERKNQNGGVGESSEEYFPDWIYKNLAGSVRWGNTREEEKMARKMIIVGLYCIQTLPEERPSMSDVVAMLEGNGDGLQIPPKPTLFGPPTAELPKPSSSSSSFSSSRSYLKTLALGALCVGGSGEDR
ncbi:LEAF RUST 10 DISEASE-RESISTANCE LOCUS RECEPTOR-LIKE PROTEIN KINASE-like 2.4 [Momordica charantia]|uniref:non-specific serine/threonine protein kinase n=1 Tax=Momordica charantia TaxID=3673 RepID=A0A6J1C5I6_MOMCH|nr:LEAF RUST 10 DISEASE-RESISTANCE LOCUS RECEPTOR-LIKE PROTEIN KINASE-like 2.4 [Momordica charantia]